MAQYVDIDELLRKLPDDLPYKASVKRVLMQAPAADVVPKSEVENIFEEIEFDIRQLDFDREETRAIAIEGIIANAKKKHTGDDQ